MTISPKNRLLTPKDVAELLQVVKDSMIQPRWLKLKQAAFYSNIGQARLKDLARKNIIKGYQDKDSGRGDWIFDKESIDQYRSDPFNKINVKAKEILAKIKRKRVHV